MDLVGGGAVFSLEKQQKRRQKMPNYFEKKITEVDNDKISLSPLLSIFPSNVVHMYGNLYFVHCNKFF